MPRLPGSLRRLSLNALHCSPLSPPALRCISARAARAQVLLRSAAQLREGAIAASIKRLGLHEGCAAQVSFPPVPLPQSPSYYPSLALPPPLLSLARPPSLPLPLTPALPCPSLPLAHSPALPLPLAARAAPRPPGAALFMPLPSIRHPPVEHRDIAMQSSSAENVPTRGD